MGDASGNVSPDDPREGSSRSSSSDAGGPTGTIRDPNSTPMVTSCDGEKRPSQSRTVSYCLVSGGTRSKTDSTYAGLASARVTNADKLSNVIPWL